MKRRLISVLSIFAGSVALTSWLCLRPAGAEHFNIVLQAESGADKVSATTDTTPPIGGVNPRPVLKVKSGDKIKVTWKMSSGFPHGTMKNVTVHFFVVREQSLAQKPVPDPAGSGGVIDTSFNMDFLPKSATAGTVQFTLPGPGNYIVRIQSEDTHIEHDHEHFSALDLSVQ